MWLWIRSILFKKRPRLPGLLRIRLCYYERIGLINRVGRSSSGYRWYSEREIATVAMLTVLGREPQLRVHLQAAFNVGLTTEELEEISC
ncbi:carboxymuconolactone decarboxylase family protein [Brevibacillus humidisoli]|uniref:carboxymuconolactone decarboxylase family protein n=1 Tax=Brevibacillus humidisoli TaxID=2895522 RepID=UPI001E3B5BEA|nr:carboxymuconolactone decarboxylase family protein [Brevibacillus humidisoli]UFJ39881.1 carboxymuconolactone decarboxylase family protein [Brevibacillus humidisoli]